MKHIIADILVHDPDTAENLRKLQSECHLVMESKRAKEKAELQRRSLKILEEHSVNGLLYIIGQELYHSSTTLGLDPVSSGPPQTNKLHNAM